MKGRMEMDTNDAFEQLRSELAAVEPSGAFAAGVRERVASESARRMKFWLGLAATATLGAAVGVWSWGAANTALSIPSAAPVVASVPDLPVPVVSPPPPTEPVRLARPVRRVPLAAASVTSTEARLEVLVPPDQAAGVRRLLILHGAGRRFAMTPDGHAVDELTGALQELAPIQIPQITIELLPGTVPGVGGKGK